MGVSFFKGSFTKNNTTGDQDITTPGFQPKAVILWGNLSSSESYSVQQWISYGFADGTNNNVCVTFLSQDGFGTSNSLGNVSNDKCFQIFASGGTLWDSGSITSMLSTGFRINWSTSNSASIIHFIAIAGTDITNVKCGTQSVGTTTTGNKSYTGAGFQPDFLLNASSGFLPTASAYTFNETAETHAGMQIGCATSPSSRFAISVVSESGRPTSDTHRFQVDDKCFLYLDNTTGTTLLDADFVSFDSDGWTWDYTTNTTANNQNGVYIYLAIKGGVWDIGEHDGPTTDSTTTINTTVGSGNTLKGAMFYSVQGPPDTTTLQTHNRLCIGGSDSSNNQGMISGHDTDNAGTTITVQIQNDNNIMYMMTANATEASSTTEGIGTATFSTNSISIAWTSTDGTARELVYWALSEAGVGGGGGNGQMDFTVGTSVGVFH